MPPPTSSSDDKRPIPPLSRTQQIADCEKAIAIASADLRNNQEIISRNQKRIAALNEVTVSLTLREAQAIVSFRGNIDREIANDKIKAALAAKGDSQA